MTTDATNPREGTPERPGSYPKGPIETLDTIILNIAHKAGLIPRGKTITADWFPEAKEDLVDLISATVDEIIGDDYDVDWKSHIPADEILKRHDELANAIKASQRLRKQNMFAKWRGKQ